MIELGKWQSTVDGFPTADYFDAVVGELHKAGVVVDEYWREARHSMVILISDDVSVGWSVNEESDPLHVDDDAGWHGFHGQEGICGWWWREFTPDTGGDAKPVPVGGLDVLAEPSEVAATVAALVRSETKEI